MNIPGGRYVLGLGPNLVVEKRNSQSIEVAPRSTKGWRKVRIHLTHTGVGLIFLCRLVLANSKYPLQTLRLDASCCDHLAPSRRVLASTHVTLGKRGGISSVLRGKFAVKIRLNPNIVLSQRRSVLWSTRRIATDLFRTLTNPLKQPKKENPMQGHRFSRPDKRLSRNWKRSSAGILLPCSRGSTCYPTQSPQFHSIRRTPRELGPRSLNRSYRVLYQHTHRTRPRSFYVSNILGPGKRFGTKREFNTNGTMLSRYNPPRFGWHG
jgi:hypothetical protein